MTLQDFAAQLLALLAPVSLAAVSAVGVWTLRWLGRRLRVQTTAAEDALIRAAVGKAIAGAEEWAARSEAAGQQITSAAKQDIVVAEIGARWPGLTRDRIVQLTDAALAQTPDLGATGARVVAVGVVGMVGVAAGGDVLHFDDGGPTSASPPPAMAGALRRLFEAGIGPEDIRLAFAALERSRQ